MRTHDRGRQGEAQTGATHAARSRCVRSREAREESRAMLLGDARTLIAHRDPPAAVAMRAGNRDLSAARRMANRVVHKVVDDSAKKWQDTTS